MGISERADDERTNDRREHSLYPLYCNASWTERVRGGEAFCGSVAFLLLELTGLTAVNDTLGYDTGAALLDRAAGRLRAWLPPGSFLARSTGNQFVMCVAVENLAEAVECARSLLGALRAPFLLCGQELFSAAGLGLAISPEHGTDLHTLQRNADTALRSAQEAGSGFAVYVPEMSEAAKDRMRLENALRRAANLYEFWLAYQPKVEVGRSEITGYEALLRWTPPGVGTVLPSKFVPILEETGLITSVGRWAMHNAFSAFAKRPVRERIAINISTLQFERDDFLEVLQRRQRAAAIDPHRIDLELTESCLLRDINGAARKMATLRDAGFGITIDDFGTGYSSLSCLHRLPITSLKIDSAFVYDIERSSKARHVVNAIVQMAHGLGVSVTAEGVERDDQMQIIRELEIDEVQGWLTGVPGPLPSPLVKLPTDGIIERGVDAPTPASAYGVDLNGGSVL